MDARSATRSGGCRTTRRALLLVTNAPCHLPKGHIGRRLQLSDVVRVSLPFLFHFSLFSFSRRLPFFFLVVVKPSFGAWLPLHFDDGGF